MGCVLHKRIHEKDERVFQLEHKNGRRLLVVLPPDTQAVSSFEQEACRTKWVTIMLNNEERVDGMLSHLAKTYPENFERIGRNRKLSTREVALNTVQTIALARVGRLNDVRMKKIKSFLRHMGKINLQLSVKEQERIDVAVGLYRTKEITFGCYLHEWSTNKGKEKKAPEQVHYWNANLSNEIEVEADLYLHHLFLENKNNNDCPFPIPPCLDYDTNGFEKKGVTVLFGGDHGDHHCPISVKLNLCPPEERKRRKELGYQCPVVCFASVSCSKDTYELMDSTVMPTIKQQLLELQKKSLVTVYHMKNMQQCYQSYMVPCSIRPATIAFLLKTNEVDGNVISSMTFAYGNCEATAAFGSIDLLDPKFIGIPHFELRARLTITSFNKLFIGDLAFLAMLIGMNNSSGSHCLMCMRKGSDFNCNHNQLTKRTKESLVNSLEEYILKSNNPTRKGPPNVNGVNGPGLWNIDPQRIIIPILHCPMGLVDKILESFKAWVNLEVEDFQDEETEGVRSVYLLTRVQHKAAIEAHEQARSLALANPASAPAREMEKEADKARIKAKKAEAKAKELYREFMLTHNAKKTSLNQRFETIYRANNVKREHYHGGKFNGVNCIRIMSNSTSIVLGTDGAHGFLQLCLQNKTVAVASETVQSTCEQYCRLLGLLDAIWSTVRGLDAGLLPTEAQQLQLQQALLEAKELWISMRLSTLQPKWHLTFDGHLLEQFKKFGGLADKSDETIEKGHQTLKHLRERFRGISSYEVRETCIRRELRRSKSIEIQDQINRYEAMIKQAPTTKRAIDSTERQDNKKKAKQEKREAFIAL
jgi:hypothetical protein